ncbi:MAG: class I SAM-dependent methyltransferase [Spirochaetaceae bacterium]|nr:MAG: class I SAM-dependent methyltransferase [Spirochaetaceae bacterium]
MAASGVIFDMVMAPLESSRFGKVRTDVVGRAHGAVLEVGAGTGATLPYYRWDSVASLTMVDLRLDADRIARRVRRLGLNGQTPGIVLVNAVSVENLPFADESFDSVVFTLLFCSVDNPDAGAREVKRVLKPGGNAFFVEHVLSDKPALQRPMRSITPAWRRMSGNCRLDRTTIDTFTRAGLTVTERPRLFAGVFASGTARRG